MDLKIDFNTLTMDEAETVETVSGMGLTALGAAFNDPEAPKMAAIKALAVVAYRRENGGTVKAAIKHVGEMPLTAVTGGEDAAVEVTAGEHPTVESGS